MYLIFKYIFIPYLIFLEYKLSRMLAHQKDLQKLKYMGLLSRLSGNSNGIYFNINL